jgi:hypothetical protein
MISSRSSVTKALINDFEASSSVIYALNDSLRIIYCNAAWDRFAEKNGGDGCRRERVIGTDVTSVITGPLRSFYLHRFTAVIENQWPWEHDYECSAVEARRFFHMRVLPWKNHHLLIENSLVVERPHDPHRLRMPPIETMYRNSQGSIVMCAHCRRTRRISPSTPIWDWVPDFVSNIPQRTSHGLCENCHAYYFG